MRISTPVLLLCFASGCATVFSDQHPFPVRSNPSGAQVSVVGDGLPAVTTPAALAIKPRDSTALKFTKSGYRDTLFVVHRSFRKIALFNSVNPVAWLIDWKTGAFWTFSSDSAGVSLVSSAVPGNQEIPQPPGRDTGQGGSQVTAPPAGGNGNGSLGLGPPIITDIPASAVPALKLIFPSLAEPRFVLTDPGLAIAQLTIVSVAALADTLRCDARIGNALRDQVTGLPSTALDDSVRNAVRQRVSEARDDLLSACAQNSPLLDSLSLLEARFRAENAVQLAAPNAGAIKGDRELTFFFDFGKSTLRPADRTVLTHTGQRLAQYDSAMEILVEGYADPAGSPVGNLKLAQGQG